MFSFASKCSGSPCHKTPKKQPLPPMSCYDTPPSSPSLISSLFLNIPSPPVCVSPPPPCPPARPPCSLPVSLSPWCGVSGWGATLSDSDCTDVNDILLMLSATSDTGAPRGHSAAQMQGCRQTLYRNRSTAVEWRGWRATHRQREKGKGGARVTGRSGEERRERARRRGGVRVGERRQEGGRRGNNINGCVSRYYQGIQEIGQLHALRYALLGLGHTSV